jgi:hypothetical protein
MLMQNELRFAIHTLIMFALAVLLYGVYLRHHACFASISLINNIYIDSIATIATAFSLSALKSSSPVHSRSPHTRTRYTVCMSRIWAVVRGICVSHV